MLSSSDVDLTEAIDFLAHHGLEAGFVVPTATGLRKGIMDAHEQVRSWLLSSDLHDFGVQEQGSKGKVLLRTTVPQVGSTTVTTTSLYRPMTKGGDPRLWIYGLGELVSPGNLLALLKVGPDKVAVVNMSDADLLRTADTRDSPLEHTLRVARTLRDGKALELLDRLRHIESMGYVKSMRAGDTGVGFTLESLLGISANSSKAPDWCGIELKSSRSRVDEGAVQRESRSTLFSRVPDWSRSTLSPARLLERCGYRGKSGELRLYCTVANSPNAQKLFFTVDDFDLNCRHGINSDSEGLVVWSLEALQNALTTKHKSTFWVQADTRTHDGSEYFHYRRVTRTKDPLAANLGPLLQQGVVTMDFTLKQLASRVRDRGYLFKIWRRDLHLLIPEVAVEELGPARPFPTSYL